MGRKLQFIVLMCVLLLSCDSIKPTPVINFPSINNVYTKNGAYHGYEIKPNTPSIVTLITGVNSIDRVYKHTPKDKINKIIKDNPDFQFIFYFDIKSHEFTELQIRMTQYNIDYPVIVDTIGLFAKNNPPISDYCNTASVMCDKKQKLLGCVATIGSNQSFFDSRFVEFKRKYKRRL